MKVKELIEALSKMDGDKQVFVSDEEFNWSDEVVVQARDKITTWSPDAVAFSDHHDVVVVY